MPLRDLLGERPAGGLLGPQYKGLPVLSVSAPFKFGFSGGNDYNDVPAGNIAAPS